MGNEIVKFSNQFNNQALRKFTALDLDVLMTICAKMRDQGTGQVEFSFDELRKLARVKKNLTNKQVAKQVIEVNDRLLALRFRFVDGSKTIQFALFSYFETDEEAATLTVAVNERFEFLLNELTSQFTRFELAEFTDLKSSYAKEFYRRAKQFRKTGVWKIGIDDFRRLLDVPKSYRVSDLNRFVLKPILEELKPLMHLKVERRYAKKDGGRGRSSLSGFVFRFDRDGQTDKPVIEAEAVPVPSGLSDEEREQLAQLREAHGGSLFAGSKNYKPIPSDGTLVDVPLFEDGGEA